MSSPAVPCLSGIFWQGMLNAVYIFRHLFIVEWRKGAAPWLEQKYRFWILTHISVWEQQNMTEVCCDVSPSFCINQQSNSLTSASIMFHGLSPESNVNITKLANSSKFHSFSLTGPDLHMGGYNYLHRAFVQVWVMKCRNSWLLYTVPDSWYQYQMDSKLCRRCSHNLELKVWVIMQSIM